MPEANVLRGGCCWLAPKLIHRITAEMRGKQEAIESRKGTGEDRGHTIRQGDAGDSVAQTRAINRARSSGGASPRPFPLLLLHTQTLSERREYTLSPTGGWFSFAY